MVPVGLITKIVPRVMDRVRPGWRARRSTRKSPWHLFKGLLLFGSVAILFRLLMLSYRWIQIFFFSNESLAADFGWGLLPLIAPSFGIAIFVTNLFLHAIPDARRSFEEEADGDPELMYESAMSSIRSIVFKYIVPVSFGISCFLMWVLNT